MGRFRKKPVEVEAWEFTREALKSTDSWVRLYGNELHLISQYAGEVLYIEIDTLEGTMRANLGDFIIKGIQGEFYPCKPDIFKATYEAIQKLNKFIGGTNYASSQLCSNCGNKSSQTKDLSCRTYICPVCGMEMDRDINASKNLLKLAM